MCENWERERERERELSYGSVKQIVKDSKEWTNLGVNSFLLYMELWTWNIHVKLIKSFISLQ